MSKILVAISTLIGTIIGAGILGLPYVVMKSGFLLGIFNMILVGFIVLMINLYLGEITLRTKSQHHLAGHASIYLSKKGKTLMFISLVLGIYSALVAYLIGEGESLSFLIFRTTDYSLYFGIIFWIFMSFVTYYGLESLKKGEKTGVAAIIILILLVIFLFWNKIDTNNLSYNNPSLFYVPFSVTLFAFLGFSTIPEVRKILYKEPKNLKKTILISIISVFFIYLIFTAIVVGYQGANTPEIATLALGKIFVLLGMLTIGTSYLALTVALADSIHYDFHKSKTKSWLYTISFPLIIYIFLTIFKLDSFIKVLGIGGVISGSLAGILILLMIKKAKKKSERKPEYSIPYSNILAWLIILILITGTILELVKSI